MTLTLGIALGLALAGAVLATYYRWKLSRAEAQLDAVVLERNSWAAQNRALGDQLARSQRELAARQAREAKEDAKTADAARGSAARAVELLRSLNPGAGGPAEPAVRPGAGADVADPESRRE